MDESAKAVRVFLRGRFELHQINTRKLRSRERVNHCTGLMHTAAYWADALPPDEREPFIAEINEALKLAFTLGEEDPFQPMKSGGPYAFLVAYPRSENNVLVQSLASLLQAQILSHVDSTRTVMFSKKTYPEGYPFTRLILDHFAREELAGDRCIFVIRDGRETVGPLAHLLITSGTLPSLKDMGLVEFLGWLRKSEDFENWSAYMKRVEALKDKPDKIVVPFEVSAHDASPLKRAMALTEGDHGFPPGHVEKTWATRTENFQKLTQAATARARAARDGESPAGGARHWSQDHLSSTWRESWDFAARKAFHETGATDYLIEHGFETDPGWWKD